MKIVMRYVWYAVAGLCIVGLLVTWNLWYPTVRSTIEDTILALRGGSSADKPGTEEQADNHASHQSDDSLKLSDQALRNIGLTAEQIQPVALTTFRKMIDVPAIITERSGRSRVQVAAPMTGVVTRVHHVQSEAVAPGALLFEIRLTHEDLVKAQTDFLQTIGELDVENREMQRLKEVTQSGALAGRVLLEREYQRDRLTASLNAQREALRLHGLYPQEIQDIEKSRRLLREVKIYAPVRDAQRGDELKIVGGGEIAEVQPPENTVTNRPIVMHELHVHPGQSVAAGETLCTLTDYKELYIEGHAFEQDSTQLALAAVRDWPVTAVMSQHGQRGSTITDLHIAYVSNHVDLESRTLKFYVALHNEISGQRDTDGGRRFLSWRYRPGQRLQLRVPIEEWENEIVLPLTAIAREGAEYYVFQQNGKFFTRRPVHVKYRDQASAVIANDGSLFPRDVVAMRSAYQLLMELKKQSTSGGSSGGNGNSHAGHSHF